MRTIKFRGVSQATGNMVYGDLVVNKPTLSYRIIECFALVTNAKYRVGECHEISGKISLVKPETVGQFTGLKNKNGKEIYEGDVLKHHGIIAWNDIEHRWSAIDLNWNDKREWHDIDYLTSPFEIIGNVHENPELLKS